MKKIIKLTESDLFNIVKNVLSEQVNNTLTLNPKNLKFGDKGDNVRILQQKLINMGLLKTKSGKTTGYFGNLTNAALKKALSKMTPFKPNSLKFDTVINKSDTTIPSNVESIKSKMDLDMRRMNEFRKGIVPVKKDTGIKPHYRIYTDFLKLRKSPITTNDFTSEELKTILGFIKNSKVGKQPKNVNFSSTIDYSKVKTGEEEQLNPDIKKSIGYVLGNASVKDMGTYYEITDIYDFNNYKNHPENYTLENLPSTVKTAVSKVFSGNYVQGLEELSSYYQKLGYEGIPVKIDIPKNLA
jgi:peptidoglycan hydrolase-like protein with peptidoglycan-binding domain